MSKLYYDDPLQAAIMARDFGVEYYEVTDYHDTEGHKYLSGYGNYFYQIRNNGQVLPITYEGGDEVKHYIHPDSYSTFEPRAGDVVLEEGIEPKRIYDIRDGWWFSCADFKIIKHKTVVILRDNKPFFTPITEVSDD